MTSQRRIFADADEQARFDAQGFVRMPVLDAGQVADLLAAMGRLDPADGFAPEQRYHCSFLDARLAYKQAAFTLMRDSFAGFMAKTLPGWSVLSANFYVKPPGRGELSAHQNWPGIDDLDDTTLTVWCPLVDCDEKNGTIHVVPGSHKLLPHVETVGAGPYFSGFLPELKQRYLEPLATRAGQGVVFDDSLIHWSPDNRSDSPRVAVQLLCVPDDARPAFYFPDGDAGFDRIAMDASFFLTHSLETLGERQPHWRSIGHVPNRNRALDAREFSRLLARKRKAAARTPRPRWSDRIRSALPKRAAATSTGAVPAYGEPQRPPAEAGLNDRASAALVRALDFLARVQQDNGEFGVLTSLRPDMADEGTPDPAIFPTALVAHCLSFAPSSAQPARERAIAFLLRQRDHNGLWRHWTREHPQFRQLPPDLDDTSCVSAVVAASGPQDVADRALLLANRNRRGLFLTWIVPGPGWRGLAHARATLPQLAHLPTLAMFFHKTSAAIADVDAVVNANCLHYLGAFAGHEPVVAWLLDILRRGEEAHADKWYRNPFVVRYFLARALVPLTVDAAPVLRARAASASPQSALDRALTICTLLTCAAPVADELVEELLVGQRADGCWPRAAVYYGGSARRRDGTLAPAHPDTPNWGSEELTTAFAVEALSRWLTIRAR